MTPYDPYSYPYYYETPDMQAMESITGALMTFVLFYYVMIMAVSVAVYVFQSLSMYTIAKRRGIRNPWLSWIPVGSMWILGSISDQYQYVVKGRVRNRRKLLLGLMIAIIGLYFVMYLGMIAMILGIAGESGAIAGTGIAMILLPALAWVVILILATVYQYIATYDLYRSCDPDNAVLYLVLSIFFSILMPIFFFICRKKDLGMPPRKTIPQPIPEPVWEPEV